MILETGHYWFGESRWGDGPYAEDTLTEMREAWADCGHEILAERDPGWHFPWAWWLFEAPEPRDESLPEFEQLERWGLLTAADLEVLNGNAHGTRNYYYEDPFRHTWNWWRFLAPERRNRDVPEAIQLAGWRDVLNEREIALLDTGIDPCVDRNMPAWRKVDLRYLDLDDAERAHLGLPLVNDDEDDE